MILDQVDDIRQLLRVCAAGVMSDFFGPFGGIGVPLASAWMGENDLKSPKFVVRQPI